jgi:hypothetical protein
MIDHVFMLVEADGPEIRQMSSLGLAETYRRVHRGQGTRNICYCFDNMFLELIWVDDLDTVRSLAIKRTGLYERSLWRTIATCPFGIAWRRSSANHSSQIPTWNFTPPYLPAGTSIAVATDGDDPRQPMMFESPGSVSPMEWPLEKRGSLQHHAGLGPVTEISLMMPMLSPASAALTTIAERCAPSLRVCAGTGYGMSLQIASSSKRPDLHIALPLAS